MILNNANLLEYINNNPDIMMVRINPNTTSLENIIWHCEQAKAVSTSVIVQITTEEYSEALWASLNSERIISYKENQSSFIPELEKRGYVIYIPSFNGNSDIINNFSQLDLGLSIKNKNKFKNCYDLLSLSYAQFIS